MIIRVLGPLRVVINGTPVPLGGKRAQIILASLALAANRVVPLDHLVDAVWGAAPPVTARTQIRICVSTLRRALASAGAPNMIETYPASYGIRVAAGELDAAVFDAEVARAHVLAAEGRLAEATGGLRRALALWRGPALAGLSSPAVRSSARRLEEQRLRATTERVRLELELGWHEHLVGELVELVSQHPFHERLHRLFMLALYRSGRTAEALAVYRTVRATLVEELGIEPGPELSSLEQKILLRE